MATLTGKSIATTYDQLWFRGTTEPSGTTGAVNVLTTENDGTDDLATPLYLGTARIGIGAAAPTALLHTAANDETTYNGDALAGEQVKIYNDVGSNGLGWTGLKFYTRSTGYNDGEAWIGAVMEGANYADLVFGVRDSDGNSKEKMRLTKEGKVGIGTASPAYPLDLDQDGAAVDGNFYGLARFTKANDTGAIVLGYDNSDATVSIIGTNQANGELAFWTNNGSAYGESVRIDKDGKVGIGTTSPGSVSTGISNAGADLEEQVEIRGGTGNGAAGAGNLILSTAAIDVAANDVLGCLAFQAPIEATTTDAVLAGAAIWAVSEGDFAADNNATSLQFLTAASAAPDARMTITGAGHIGMGTNSPSHFLTLDPVTDIGTEASSHLTILAGGGFGAHHWLDATAYYIGQDSGSRSLRIYSSAEAAGAELAATGTSFGTFSDERVKRDIVEIDGALDKLKDIRCVNYNYKFDDEDQDKRMGIIAQDLIGKYDEALFETQGWGDLIEDGNEYYSVTYQDLIPPLIKAIQELSAKVTALENA